MSITFEQGTALYLSDGESKYRYTIGSLTASQTFIESRQDIKTIHNRIGVERTFSTEKSPANISFSLYLGEGLCESELLNWFDMPSTALLPKTHNISSTLNGSPSTRTIYLESGNTVYKLPIVVGENISFTIAHSEVLKANITATASDLLDITADSDEVTDFNSLPTIEQDYSTFQVGSVEVTGYENLLGVTLELTRGINWLSQKSVFDIGSIYKASVPRLDSLSISGTITQVKVNNTDTIYTPNSQIEIIHGGTFKVLLSDCNLTERWELGNYHRIQTDYAMLPTSTDSYIQF